LFFPFLVTILPVASSYKLWHNIWLGGQPRAWDGTGHYAIAQIYARSIFPGTFGWTNNYFAGMPFPNFYPPLFYWCVGLLYHTHLVSFATAFKTILLLPVLLMPASLCLLGWTFSEHSRLVTTATAVGSLFLLMDERLAFSLPAGLDYFSTFQIGLYTQPLGFVLLIAWSVVYLTSQPRCGRFVVSSLLLSLTVLANFFNAVTAALFIAATLAFDLARYLRQPDEVNRRAQRDELLAHLFSPLVAAGLTLFWIVPMLGEYKYFVTRPYILDAGLLITPALRVWYAIAIAGAFAWVRRPTRAMWPYLSTCLLLTFIAIFASTIAPPWFPLQAPRFLATLNFLLAVPVGQALATAYRFFARTLGEISQRNSTLTLRRVPYTTGVALAILFLLVLTSPGLRWGRGYAFYPKDGPTEIGGLMDFARQHHDGRYLVEVINPQINPNWTEASFDARAINSYLGAQGNETISGVFHEASPNALFTLPVVNSLSNYPVSFGISSVLADDLDFKSQPLAQHIERARFLGVKYLIIRTPAMKELVAKESAIGERHDFGWWTIFELQGKPLPPVRLLPNKPALVISDFTLKARRRNESSFIRFAEEQFADNWFDVLLVRSPEIKIDHLNEADNFGALILDTYEYDDETAAYAFLRNFCQRRILILLPSESSLYKRISAARVEFPLAKFIERPAVEPGSTLEALQPIHHYNESPLRQTWKAIRRVLEDNKVAADFSSSEVTSEITPNRITIGLDRQLTNEMPVLISTTYHPNWHRDDEGTVYAVTPFYMLAFIRHPVTLEYSRNKFDKAGGWISVFIFFVLCLSACWSYLQNNRRPAL
jgi:hypothetical protein